VELVYLWVEDYKNIKKQGFNFLPRFECSFDGKTLTIDEKKEDEYIKDFFGKNINVTAIVGKNGSGKSSVLECIKIAMELFIEQKEYVYFSEYLYFLKCIPYLESINFQNPYILIFQNEDLFYNISINSPKNINTNFITNHIKNDIVKNILQYHSLYPFIKEELPLQLILDTFFFPKKIMNFFNPNIIIINLTKWLNQETCFSHSIKEQLEYIVKELKNNLSTNQEKEYQSLFIIQEYIENNDLDEFKEYKQMFYSFNFSKDLNQELQNFLLALNSFSLIEIFDSRKDENYMNYEGIPLNFGMSYNHLSDGEKHLLSVLLSISKIVYTKNRTENILIFLDELENELHPEWQRTIVSELINSCNLNPRIHFIITSHSPFLLSDIPKQNIIFLNKDENGNCKVVNGLKEKKETFGANIHTLLSDSFFMDNGLMGEFAKGKINEIIKNLKDKDYSPSEKEKKQVYLTIESIGEPFLKQKLSKMYFDKFDTKKQDRIKELEAELKRLKNG